jgi:glycosyltransferase involved in cell wall biosynthesis
MRAFGLVPPVSTRKIARLLEGFRPDVVLCVMQHAVYYDAAQHFARAGGLPLVVLVHDVNEEFEPVFPWAVVAMRRRDGEFYRYASRRLCISPEMERFCASIYGAPGSVLYPNRSEDLEARPPELCEVLRRPQSLTVGFAGNLNYGYGEGIIRMLPAIRAAQVRLIIYGRPPAGAAAPLAEATDCCEFRGFAPSAQAWADLQRDCDAFWLPYPDLGGQMERLYRHHFPSKLPEYLALGMPVIVTGPEYATGMAWARRNLGPELCANGEKEATHVFRSLASDPALRRRLAERCLQSGQRDFDPVKIVSEFYGHLAAAAAEGRPIN